MPGDRLPRPLRMPDHARNHAFQIGVAVYTPKLLSWREVAPWIYRHSLVTGTLSSFIELANGARVRCHQDQLLSFGTDQFMQELPAVLNTAVDTYLWAEELVKHPLTPNATLVFANAASGTPPRHCPLQFHQEPLFDMGVWGMLVKGALVYINFHYLQEEEA